MRSRAGFSLVEALVASAVLAVAITGLTEMYTSAVRGYVTSQRLQEAVEIAGQRAEQLATLPPETVPACSGPTTCRDNGGRSMTSALTSVAGFACTAFMDTPAVVGPDGTPPVLGQRFRVDTVVSAHPDSLRQPDAQVLTVSVCWTDGNGFVHEVQSQRLLVPGA